MDNQAMTVEDIHIQEPTMLETAATDILISERTPLVVSPNTEQQHVLPRVQGSTTTVFRA
jgi:hypothetical protein